KNNASNNAKTSSDQKLTVPQYRANIALAAAAAEKAKREQEAENEDEEDDMEVMLIDFEYASYNYRGFDLAAFCAERCFQYDTNAYPYFACDLDAYPTQEQRLEFVGAYRAACRRILTGQDPHLGPGGRNGDTTYDPSLFTDQRLLH